MLYTFAINVFGGENVSMGKRGQHLRGRYFATNYIREENRRKRMTEEEKRREDIINSGFSHFILTVPRLLYCTIDSFI